MSRERDVGCTLRKTLRRGARVGCIQSALGDVMHRSPSGLNPAWQAGHNDHMQR